MLTRSTRAKFNPLYLIALVTVLQLAVTLLSDGFVLSFDESIWHYIGRNWFRHGMPPYTGGVDNKSPFIFAIFGLSDILFGVHYWFPRVVGTLCQSVGLYYLYKITRQLAGEMAGIMLILFYGLSVTWHDAGGVYVSFTETYEVMFVIMSFYKFLAAENNRDLILSGVLMGLAFDFRFVAVFSVVILLVYCLWNRGWTSMLMTGMGMVVGVAALVLFCLLVGINLTGMLHNGLLYDFGKGSVSDHAMGYRLDNLINKFLLSDIAYFYPLFILYIIVVRKLDLPVIWVLMSFVGINLVGNYDLVHFKEILPGLALTNAIAISYIINNNRSMLLMLATITVLNFIPDLKNVTYNFKVFTGRVIPGYTDYAKYPELSPTERERKDLGKWIKVHTLQDDRVLVYSYGMQIQVYSERLAPSKYFIVMQLPGAKEGMMKDIQQHMPAMMLIPVFNDYAKTLYPDLNNYVDSLMNNAYLLDTTLYNYKVFRLK